MWWGARNAVYPEDWETIGRKEVGGATGCQALVA